MSGRRSRTKGHNFERWVAKQLRDFLGIKAVRGWQSRFGGKEEADVIAEGLPFHFECKTGKKPGVRAAMKQAEGDRKPNMHPVVVIKDDGGEPCVYMRWDLFLLFSELWLKENK